MRRKCERVQGRKGCSRLPELVGVGQKMVTYTIHTSPEILNDGEHSLRNFSSRLFEITSTKSVVRRRNLVAH